MSISHALSSAYSGLSAAAQRANIASNNIANASTPGYAKRELQVAELVLNGVGSGVRVTGVSRGEAMALTTQRRLAESAASRAQELSAVYTDLNRLLGEPDDDFGLFGVYDTFESVLRDLSVTPESTTLQSRSVAAAGDIATQLNMLAEYSEKLRSNADADIHQLVKTVNMHLEAVVEINGHIAGVDIHSEAASGLLDERKRLVDTISTIVPVREMDRGDGVIDLITNEGVYVIAGEARALEFSQSGTTAPGWTMEGGHLSRLTVRGIDITPGSDRPLSLQSGKLSALFAIRDDVGTTFTQKIDALAEDLIHRFSADAIDPTKTVGEAGLFTDNGMALDATNTTGLARRIKLNAAIDPAQGGAAWRMRDGIGATAVGPAGAATIPTALLDAFTAKQTLPGGASLFGTLTSTEAAAGILSSIGDSRLQYDSIQTSTQSRANALYDNELAAVGVDTDQEVQSLLLIEQSYAANAKVIQVIDEMINTLLAI